MKGIIADQILTTDHEYAAVEKLWAYVARRTGAEIVVVNVPLPLVAEAQFTEAVLSSITDRTRVLFLSHITSPTALHLPIQKAVAAARERGIFSIIDGAHTPGHIPLDLEAVGADFYAGNCHKWMMAPKGSAFLYVRPELQRTIRPFIISHGWAGSTEPQGSKGAFGNSRFIDELETLGTRDPAAWLTVPTAIAFQSENDWTSVAAYCHQLAQETAGLVSKNTREPALCAPEFCAPQMVSIPIGEFEPSALAHALLERYRIEIPVFKWHDRTLVRLSVQGYNSQTQMGLLIGALAELLA